MEEELREGCVVPCVVCVGGIGCVGDAGDRGEVRVGVASSFSSGGGVSILEYVGVCRPYEVRKIVYFQCVLACRGRRWMMAFDPPAKNLNAEENFEFQVAGCPTVHYGNSPGRSFVLLRRRTLSKTWPGGHAFRIIAETGCGV